MAVVSDTGIRELKLLAPPGPSGLVVRPRLWELLDRLSELPITLITAPAGYGKTNLLASWIRVRAEPKAWYTADASDRDLYVFVGGLMRAIRSVVPDFGVEVESCLISRGAPDRLAVLFSDDLFQLSQPLTLIVDDMHLATGDGVLQFLNTLFRFPAPSLHLLSVGQRALPISIQHLVERGLVGEIGESEIAFTKDESWSFLQKNASARQPDTAIEDTINLADGWVAALNVLSLAGAGGEAAVVSSPDTTPEQQMGRRHVQDLVDTLVDRIVCNWNPAFRRFMISIAIPEQITQSLVDAIRLDDGSSQSNRRLHRLSRSGYFLVRADDRSEWYRFHGLFREALLARRADVFSDEDYARICLRIGRWHEEHGNITAAIDALLEAGAPDQAGDLVRSRLDEHLVLDRWDDVEEWLDRLPEEIVEADLALLIARAWIIQWRGKHEILRSHIHAIRQRLAASPATLDLTASKAEVALLETYLERDLDSNSRFRVYESTYEALKGSNGYAEMTVLDRYLPSLARIDREKADRIIDALFLENAARTDTFSQARLLWARFALLMQTGSSGGVANGFELSMQVLVQARRMNMRRVEAFGELGVGTYRFATNHLEDAVSYLLRAAESPHTTQRVRTAAACRLARTLDAMGQPGEADTYLERTIDRLLEADAVDFVNMVRTTQARLAIRRGNLALARRRVDELRIDDRPNFAIEAEHPLIAKIVLFSQSTDQRDGEWADASLEYWLARPTTLHWAEPIVHLTVMGALRAERTGRSADAKRMLGEAITHAERLGNLRIFSDLGIAAEDMLARYLETMPTCAFLQEQVAMLQTERKRMATNRNEPVIPPVRPLPLGFVFDNQITQRELDILSGLQRRMTNKEIAAELSISPFTVKTHTQNIYAKLGVSSRRQAIQRGTALGLLPEFPSAS